MVVQFVSDGKIQTITLRRSQSACTEPAEVVQQSVIQAKNGNFMLTCLARGDSIGLWPPHTNG